jgi:hypothetical protein
MAPPTASGLNLPKQLTLCLRRCLLCGIRVSWTLRRSSARAFSSSASKCPKSNLRCSSSTLSQAILFSEVIGHARFCVFDSTERWLRCIHLFSSLGITILASRRLARGLIRIL